MEDNQGHQWLPHSSIGTIRLDATGYKPMVSIGMPTFDTRPNQLGGAVDNDQESNDDSTKELCTIMQSEDFFFLFKKSSHIAPAHGWHVAGGAACQAVGRPYGGPVYLHPVGGCLVHGATLLSGGIFFSRARRFWGSPTKHVRDLICSLTGRVAAKIYVSV